jgi:hypothetical protein
MKSEKGVQARPRPPKRTKARARRRLGLLRLLKPGALEAFIYVVRIYSITTEMER